MKIAGKSRVASRSRLISLAVVILAAAFAFYALHESNDHPTSSDSSIDADVVHIAAAVGGRIIELPISENARVTEGALPFQIDPLPYRLAVEQTAADLDIAKAQLETQRRLLATQRSAAIIAADPTKSAQENHDLAARTLERLRPLASNGYVPRQQLDQAQVLEKDTATKLIQAQERKPPHIAQSTPRPRPKRPCAPEERLSPLLSVNSTTRPCGRATTVLSLDRRDGHPGSIAVYIDQRG